jgi:hypothetical protein
VAAVHYIFTQKQYTEQHNETEYTEQNIHNNKKYITVKYMIIRIHYKIIKNVTKRI